MDPGRRAMLTGSGSGSGSSTKRDVTSPRHDSSSRITKPTKPAPSKAAQSSAKHLSQEEQSRQYVADEDKFVLRQSRKKADIRVREQRAKPIDYLAFNLRYIDTEQDIFDGEDHDVDIEVPSPVSVVQEVAADQLSELESDITSYYVLETKTRNREYWKALQTLCADRKAKHNPSTNDDRVTSSVADDIDLILAPKTRDQLEALEKQIKTKLQSDQDIDTDYWEQLLRSLRVWKAKATVKLIYEEMSRSRLEMLKERGGDVQPRVVEPVGNVPVPAEPPRPSEKRQAPESVHQHENSNIPPGTERFSTADGADSSSSTNAFFDREVARGVSENEEVFTAEEAVPSNFKPKTSTGQKMRKPRYFNRVQMGYEWNKYNQTHYDHDNPPPKVVQGYKFNVFYPDLIDKTKAPTFKIIREHGRKRGESFASAGEEDTCLLIFIAGPPYENIAFRIVDREWDYSAKRERGFRSSFDKGILQLHFQFKKIFYRK